MPSITKKTDGKYLIRVSRGTGDRRLQPRPAAHAGGRNRGVGGDHEEKRMSQADGLVSWRELLTEELADYGETWADVVSHTLTEEQLDQRFNDGFGVPEGCPFTLWTQKRVYFPDEYDGAEGVSSVSRNPDGVPTPHV